jgi:hypothetical protein
MSTPDHTAKVKKLSPNHEKVVKFIPFKTMHMDLESILANVARIHVNRKDYAMVELLSMASPELFPIGSFDDEAEKYEYVLQLSVPVKFYHHLKNDLVDFETRLLSDIAAVTAPYNHEFISEVFIVVKIEHDSSWREAALDWAAKNPENDTAPRKEFDFIICHASEDETTVASELRKAMIGKRARVGWRRIDMVKDKDLRHLVKEVEKKSSFGIFIISPAILKMSFSPESVEEFTAAVIDPGKCFFQLWHNVGRAEVANFNASLARSLAFSTERMGIGEIGELFLRMSALG